MNQNAFAMIDKERRKKLAFHLRQLSVGLTTNDDFEDNVMNDVTNGWLPEQYYRSKNAKQDDAVIIPMLEMCWGLYDDTREHKLIVSDRLSDENLKVIARCILFLHSDYEYEWPYEIFLLRPIFKRSLLEMLSILVINILTLGWHIRNYRKKEMEAFEEFKKLGAFEYWPFFRKVDYERQLEKQPFLKV